MTQELINEIIDLVNEQRDSQGMITKVDLMLKIKTLLETNFKNSGVLDGGSNSEEQKPIKYKCLFCQRSFNRRIPHNCKGGFRKRKIEWEPIYE